MLSVGVFKFHNVFSVLETVRNASKWWYLSYSSIKQYFILGNLWQSRKIVTFFQGVIFYFKKYLFKRWREKNSFCKIWKHLGLGQAEVNGQEVNLRITCGWYKYKYLRHHVLPPRIQLGESWGLRFGIEPRIEPSRSNTQHGHPNQNRNHCA